MFVIIHCDSKTTTEDDGSRLDKCRYICWDVLIEGSPTKRVFKENRILSRLKKDCGCSANPIILTV